MAPSAARKPASPPKPAPPPAQGALSARDASKQETREALLRAGMELFAEQGLDVPSLDALCARAGFTRGAFYVHFEDREDFIVAVMESATGSFLDAILATRGEALDLRALLGAFAGAVEGGGFPVFGDVPFHQFLAACARSKALRQRYSAILDATIDRIAEVVRAGQQAGTVRPDADALRVSGLLVAIALGVGAVTEIDARFDTRAHTEALHALLAPR
jgi:TetR/AcrR family transcriptional regulator, transcriptional repressor for nem operon